ncbi:MAG: alanine--tRNA ligase [Candidatus Eremiobacteraeota bacterium]|nr:alanine--tRNA ligase [Candidatus Eremiobacteraeota bacterium]
MKPQEIRQSFVDFFVSKGHKLLPPASLIPDAMSTTLFTIAGMEQFVPVFVGREPAPAPRVVTVQRCLRVAGGKSDIENVGRSGRHGTLLEMLGNFSFGDYYKREAILWAWEYLTKILRLPADRLYATVYVDDDEAAEIWQRDIGLAPERISRFREDNFWDMGPTGPCGPSSEIFYDLGPSVGCGRSDCAVGCPHCDRYVEFWNLVFQQYDREADGILHPLPNRAIDTGMGFERLCMILAGKTSIFDTQLYTGIIAALPAPTEASPLPPPEQHVHRRIIADHARAAVFLAADGISPSNNDRGYVMRFLMRRALRSGRALRLPNGFFSLLVDAVIATLADGYPQLRESQAATKAVFSEEERLFDRTLERGESRLAAVVADATSRGAKAIDGRAIFELHDTYGFPPELTAEIARENGLEADMAGYRAAMEEQRERARRDAHKKRADVVVAGSGSVDLPDSEFVGYETLQAPARILALFDRKGAKLAALEQGQEGIVVLDRTAFYAERGGQAGDRGAIAGAGASFAVSDTQYQDKTYGRIMHLGKVKSGSLQPGLSVEAIVDPVWRREIRRHHSVTHLLQRALKEMLGDAVAQRGSAVYPDHTRFDFDSPRGALSKVQERQVQARVNELIRADYHRSVEIMPFTDAISRGAVFMKGEHYGDRVRVVTFGPSIELCGGTHVESTGEIGLFVLTSESAIAAGVRRVEGVVSESADRYVMQMRDAVELAGATLKTPVDKVNETIERLAHERKVAEETIAALQARLAAASASEHLASAQNVNGVPYLAVRAADANAVRNLSDAIRARWRSGVIAVAGADAEKVSALVTVSEDLVARGISAQKILSAMMTFVNGRGGGTAAVAQGGGKNPAGIDAALTAVAGAIQAEHA